jgi:hypothetical protein
LWRSFLDVAVDSNNVHAARRRQTKDDRSLCFGYVEFKVLPVTVFKLTLNNSASVLFDYCIIVCQ